MVSDTDSTHRTNFTLSIEAAEGVTTGISAHDRAHTVKTAVAPNARPEDLRQPGHIFPLMAQPGGVLDARRPHGSGLRSGAAGRILRRRHDRRDSERRRHHGAAPGSRAVRENARPEDRHHRGSDSLSPEERALGGAHLRGAVDTEYGGFKLCCYEDHVNKTVHIALVKGDLNSDAAAAGARAHQGHACATWSACATRSSAGRCAPRCAAWQARRPASS